MKKIFCKVAPMGAFMRAFAVALLLGIVAGCWDDTDPATRGKSSGAGGAGAGGALVGTWYTTYAGGRQTWSVEFLPDKSLMFNDFNSGFTWSASGGKIKFQVNGLPSSEFATADYTIKDDLLIISGVTNTMSNAGQVIEALFVPPGESFPVTYER